MKKYALTLKWVYYCGAELIWKPPYSHTLNQQQCGSLIYVAEEHMSNKGRHTCEAGHVKPVCNKGSKRFREAWSLIFRCFTGTIVVRLQSPLQRAEKRATLSLQLHHKGARTPCFIANHPIFKSGITQLHQFLL